MEVNGVCFGESQSERHYQKKSLPAILFPLAFGFDFVDNNSVVQRNVDVERVALVVGSEFPEGTRLSKNMGETY